MFTTGRLVVVVVVVAGAVAVVVAAVVETIFVKGGSFREVLESGKNFFGKPEMGKKRTFERSELA